MTAPDFEPVARLVERLAVLTGAGIPPLSSWRYAAVEDAPAEVRQVVAGLDSAHGLAERVVEVAASVTGPQSSAWAVLAATWWTATEAGAALAATLSRSAVMLRGLAQGIREVEVALAGPMATSRIVLALPAVGLGLGMLLGFDVIGALATIPGLVCMLAGGILIAVAVRWNRRLVSSARDVDATPGLTLDLFAVALSAGASIDRARSLVESACAGVGIEPPDGTVDAVLDFARNAGVPAVALLRSEADERRRAARSLAARKAAQLETRMLLPLGLCVLPAFVLIGVAPMMIAIVSSTVATV